MAPLPSASQTGESVLDGPTLKLSGGVYAVRSSALFGVSVPQKSTRTQKMVNGTSNQVRALRKIRITALGKI